MLRRMLSRLIDFAFADAFRPVEILSAAGLSGWATFIALRPGAMADPMYSAFAVAPLDLWASLMGAVAILQVAVMVVSRSAIAVRFGGMTMSAGLWTLVAITFLTADQFTTGAHMYTAIAVLTTLAGIGLGWVKRQS